MVRYRRNFVPGGTFFFTVTLRDRRSSVLVDHVDLLRNAFRRTRGALPFDVHAIVVLPEHLHTIWTLPPSDADFSARWRKIKGAFTRSVGEAGLTLERDPRGEYDLWQRRFWEHTVRDIDDLRRCMDYIHYNPVKHGWATSPANWKLSSLHRYIREGTLPPDWGGNGAAIEGDFGEPV
ncbi:REP-associated tyrosine transposase [Afipia birgiae]|jgi:putative transposase|uniref:REP-associated tyrosine transposase n=1 Tax=Afipia birgiae TaxID=151414 RepID=UPI00037D631D|nr:transposase [Afipia birgiae]MBX9821530.1 transposase [Afipia birgiae]